MTNKELIQTRFSKTLDSYNEHARIQKKMAERLISFSDKNLYENILELGCGTGFLTKLAIDKLKFQIYTAIDIVKDCEQYINKISPKIEFIPTDIESFISKDNKKYDLILSNAAFQWVEDFEGLINSLLSKLNPNGLLLFSTFGKENFREIYHISQTSLKYYSAPEIKTMFETFTPIVEEEIHIMAFPTPKAVLSHLRLTGVNALESKTWTKSDLIQFENNYLNLCGQKPTLTYNPIYVKLRK